MRGVKWQFDKSHRCKLIKTTATAVLVIASFGVLTPAQQKGQKTFSTPEEASQALFTAAQNNDEKVLLELFGPDGKQIVSSGDEAEDTQNRANFAKRYQEMNRLVKEPDGTITLYIGPHNWPYPIPLRSKGSAWYFDTDAGRREILFRRIGWNEESAIRVCQELAAAEKEYYAQGHNEYAQKIFSEEGQKDGLYWKVAEGEPQSPIGPLVAWAVANEHAKSQRAEAVPYRGYYFHLLTSQGKDSPGGAKSYIVNGKMTEGFAFVAYPAEYQSSGVMTFLVGADGVVSEKNLGKKTESMARAMKEYNPGSGWHKVGEEQQEAAGSSSQSSQ